MSIEAKHGKRRTTYRVRLRVKDPLTGRWEFIQGGTYRTEAEAKREERRLLRDADRGVVVQGGAQPLAEYLQAWLEATRKVSKRGRPLAPTTAKRYADAVARVSASIGRVKLRDLRPVHIERFRDELLAGGLKPQTAGDIMRVLSQAMQRAVAKGLVDRNVADAKVVHRPIGEPAPFVLITRDTGERILAAARGTDPWDVAAHLALGATLRREEVLGLPWADVDLEGGRLTVRRTLTHAEGEYYFGPPKSKAGERTVHLPAFVLAALRRHKAAQAERLLAIGRGVGEQDLVVDNGIGEPWLPPSFSKGWSRFAEASGFDGVTFHGLRHGAATWLLAAGVSDTVAASIMGHADTRILRRYQDVVPELMADAAARMDALLGGS